MWPAKYVWLLFGVALVSQLGCGSASTNTNAGGTAGAGAQAGSGTGAQAGTGASGGGTAGSTTTTTIPSKDPGPGPGPARPNRAPEITSAPITNAVEGKYYFYPALADDPDGDLLSWSLTGPQGMTIDNENGLVGWLPGPGTAGSAAVTVKVTDPLGESAEQAFTVNVANGQAPPRITSTPALAAFPGVTYTYQAIAEDPDDLPAQLTWSLVGPAGASVDGAGNVTWPAPVNGNAKFTLTVKDGTNLTDTQVFSLGVGGTGAFPTAIINAPADGATVDAAVDVTGTATDEAFTGYTLQLCAGTGCVLVEQGLQPVNNGVLGRLDPGALPEGKQQLLLTVTDAEGNVATASRFVTIHSDEKPGRIRLAFDDLSVSTAQFEVDVTRIYDGVDLKPGQLGNGWRLDIAVGGKSQLSHPLHDGWDASCTAFGCDMFPTIDHALNFELPDGRQIDFTIELEHEPGAPSSISYVRPIILNDSFDGSTLELLDENKVPFSTVNYDLFFARLTDQQVYTDFILNSLWEPAYYRVKTDFGETFEFDAKTGSMGAFTDENGFLIERTANGLKVNNKDILVIETGGDGKVASLTNAVTGDKVTYQRDGNGDLVKVIGIDGLAQTFVYAPGSLLKSYQVPGQQPEVWKLDEKGRVVFHMDSDGVISITEYDDVNHTVKTSDVGGNAFTTAYDAKGHVTQVTNPLGKTAKFAYVPGTDLEQSRTDELNHTWQFAYDAKGRATQTTDPMNHVTTQKHDDKTGQITEVTDGEGRSYKVNVDAQGLPSALVLPDGQQAQTFTYPDEHTEITTDKGTNNVVTIKRDDRGRVTSRTDQASGVVEKTTYDDVMHTAKFEGPSGSMTAEMDPLGRFKSLDMGESGKFNYVRDRNDIPLSVTTPAGETYEYKRNKKGQLTQVLVDGQVAQETRYDAYGRVASTKQATGEGRNFKYDALGRLTEEKNDNGTTQYEYYDDGRKKSATTSTGVTESYAYDAAGRLTSHSQGDQTLTFTYDDSNKPLSATDEAGRTVDLGYDANGRRTKVAMGGVGEEVEYMVSDDTQGGALKKWTDTAGVAFTYGYDASQRLVSATAAGKTTSYDYDDMGTMIITDALGHKTTMVESEDLISTTTPENRTETWTLEGGAPTILTRMDGSQVHFADIEGGTATLLPSGEVFEETIDPEEGWTRNFGAPGGGVTFWSDEMEQPFYLELDDGANVLLERDSVGEVTKIVAKTPKGTKFETTYEYDVAGDITKIVDPDGQATSLAYDSGGLVSTITRPNGVVTTITYEAFERPKSIKHAKGGTTIAEYVYTYDTHGRIVTATTPEATTNYGYDALGRLTTETRNGATTTRTYDGVGNLVSLATPSGTTTFTYDKDDRLLSASGSQAATYSYNGRGALTKVDGAGGTTTYTYDDLDRLVGATGPGGTVSYQYDVEGRLLTVTDAGGTRRCLPMPVTLKGWDDCALMYSPGNNEKPEALVFGPLGLQSVHSAAAVFTLTGLEDSITRTTDSAGTVAGSWEYDAWGARSGTGTFHHGFAGERQDPTTGLVYLRSRHYDPKLGRFLTPDKVSADLSDPRTLHRYVYSMDDPLNRTDPSGGFSIGEVFSVQAIQNNMKAMKQAAVQCAKKTAISKAKSLVATWAAQMAFSMMKSVLGTASWMSLLTGGILAAKGKLSPEQVFSKVLNKVLCKMAKEDASYGASYFEFEIPVDHCGKTSGTNMLNCKKKWTTTTKPSKPGGKGANLNGIDIVAGGKLGIELKYSGKTMHLPKDYEQVGKNPWNQDGQLIRYCRWSSTHGSGGLGVMIYYFVQFPDNDYHATWAKVCWNCWNDAKFKYLVAKCKGVGNGNPGAIYLAFGVYKNKQKKRSYVPSRSTFCGY